MFTDVDAGFQPPATPTETTLEQLYNPFLIWPRTTTNKTSMLTVDSFWLRVIALLTKRSCENYRLVVAACKNGGAGTTYQHHIRAQDRQHCVTNLIQLTKQRYKQHMPQHTVYTWEPNRFHMISDWYMHATWTDRPCRMDTNTCVSCSNKYHGQHFELTPAITNFAYIHIWIYLCLRSKLLHIHSCAN